MNTRILPISIAVALLVTCASSQAPAPAALPGSGTEGFNYVLAYDTLIQVYNAYKYGARFSSATLLPVR